MKVILNLNIFEFMILDRSNIHCVVKHLKLISEVTSIDEVPKESFGFEHMCCFYEYIMISLLDLLNCDVYKTFWMDD